MILTEYIETLKKAGLFNGVQTDDLVVMMACLEPRVVAFRKNDFLALAGENFEAVGILLAGEAAAIKENAAGNRVVMEILKPGAIFGEIAVFTQNPIWPFSVVAQEPGEVLFIRRQKILGPCSRVCPWHRLIIENMLRLVSEKAMQFNQKIEYLSIKSMRGRIAAFLLDCYRRAGRTTFNLPMNRNRMAEFLNVSRPSMSREMGRMKKEGIIDFHLAAVQIKDLAALKRMAEQGRSSAHPVIQFFPCTIHPARGGKGRMEGED